VFRGEQSCLCVGIWSFQLTNNSFLWINLDQQGSLTDKKQKYMRRVLTEKKLVDILQETDLNMWASSFQVASCAKGWRDIHDSVLHTSLYCNCYGTCRCELYRQQSQVDLTQFVYQHLVLPFVSRVTVKSLPWIRLLLLLNCSYLRYCGNVLTGRCLANDICYFEIGRCLT
jgi:hypothetical protein